MKIRDVRFRDAVQVGGITAPGRVSWRDEDGPAWFNGQCVVLPEDTFVPVSNVSWMRSFPMPQAPARIDVTEPVNRGTADVPDSAAQKVGDQSVSPNTPPPGKGKKR